MDIDAIGGCTETVTLDMDDADIDGETAEMIRRIEGLGICVIIKNSFSDIAQGKIQTGFGPFGWVGHLIHIHLEPPPPANPPDPFHHIS